jgi:RHS repeat-associated protein
MTGGIRPVSAIGPATQTTASVPGTNAVPAGLTQSEKKAEASADTPYSVPRVTWPSGSATAALTRATEHAGARAAVSNGTPHKAGSLPVLLAGADASGGAASSESVSFASRSAAQAAGINGVVFTVSRADGGALPSATEVSLNYTGFAAAYGGGYVDRLNLVELPACALTTPTVAACRVQKPVSFTNDYKTGTLTATVAVGADTPSAQSATGKTASRNSAIVLATPSTGSGPVGSYTATSLSPAGSWSGGGSSGAFTYSYPITAPPTVGGTAPDVSLDYNSASVDGRTAATSAQASWIGDGWDYSPGFIERSYQTCSDATVSIANSSDLCWAGNIVTLSLAGHSGALVRVDGAKQPTWRLQNDDGTKVIALTGATNGAWEGEAWEIITPDGTQYYFGENHLPGGNGSDAATSSVWTEPVYCPDPSASDAPDAGACYNSSTGSNSFEPNMAWRWNLDYVVDPHGNLQTYTWTPETNYYDRGHDNGNGTGTNTSYTRGGYLSTIQYGYRLSDAIAGTAPLDEITFNTTGRCAPGTSNCTYSYLSQNLTSSSVTSAWPDVPADQICPTQSGTCYNYGPTYFSTQALSSIVSSVRVGSTWNKVDTYTLSQMFPSPQATEISNLSSDEVCKPNCGDGTVAVMWLASIQRTGDDTLGAGGAASALSAVTFIPEMMPNRVEYPANGVAFYRPRMDSITTESGAQIVVSYDITTSENCTSSDLPASADENNMYCFPQYSTAIDGTSAVLDWFNIYPVQEVTVNDLVAPASWSEAQITQYSYTGAAWHRDDSPLTKNTQRTWNQFRGFRTVTTTNGVPGSQDVPTQSVTTYMQGMNGDYLSDGSQRSVTIPDTAGDSVTDAAWLQGQILETDTDLGASATVENKTINGPWTYTTTATESMADSMPALTSEMLQSSKARTYQLWHDGSWKTLETDTSYDSSGRPVTADAKGDGTSAVPEVCTTTSYATSTSSDPNMLDLADEVKAVQGPCGTTATTANTVSDTLTYYDGSTTLGSLTGAGDATETQAVDSYNSSGAPLYVTEAKTGYDAYGRILSSTDANGNTTKTAYSTPSASPATITTTNLLGWTSTTTLDPARNLTLSSTDANGELTTETYDSLGRLTAVWSPLHAEAAKAPADETYSYNVSNAKPTTVTSNKLLNNGSYDPTVDFYDSSLRLIQVQAPTVDGEAGRLISDTHYNSLGQTVKTTDPYDNAASDPSTTMFNPDADGSNDTSIPLETITHYDGLGRTVQSLIAAQGTNQWSTTTAYKGVDQTDVTPPQGGTATTTFVDVLGRTIASWAYTTASPTDNAANAVVTSYTYTPASKPATMTDTAGNAWSWTYDLHGNQIKAIDPSTGTTTSAYDPNGNLLSSTDARKVTLSTSYDQLNRQTAEYNTTGGATETASDELASWTYDTLEKGQLTSDSSYTDGFGDTTQTYTETVAGYTAIYQPTGDSVSIPSAQGKLQGTYQDALQYNTAATSLPASQRYYSEGGLPNERVNDDYDAGSALSGFGGTETYLNSITYNPYGQVLETSFGTQGEEFDQNEIYDNDTGRLLNSIDSVQQSAGSSTTSPIDDTAYTYDQAGLITSESDLQTGDTTPDTQCFTYDNQDRLTAAYTDTAAVSSTTGSKTAQILGIGGCTDTTPTAGKISGGPAPYAETFTYDALGDRVAQTQLNTTTAASATTQTLAYNGYNAATGTNTAATNPDSVQKVTSISAAGTATTAYGYTDGNGETNSRTVTTTGTITASPSQKITYDAEGHTQSVTNTATNTTSTYLYAADGTLLIQNDQSLNQTTLYLPFGEEIYLNTGNGLLSGNRYITGSPDGVTIVHSSSGAITYEAGDTLHTETVAVNAANLAVTNRYYDPYGNSRGNLPSTWPDSHAFLNQPADTATGLDLLGARQYDPVTGRFLSVDPVLEVGDQTQMNGYAYAADDPVNGSDPNGTTFEGGPNGPACLDTHTCTIPGHGGNTPPPKLTCQNDPDLQGCSPRPSSSSPPSATRAPETSRYRSSTSPRTSRGSPSSSPHSRASTAATAKTFATMVRRTPPT